MLIKVGNSICTYVSIVILSLFEKSSTCHYSLLNTFSCTVIAYSLALFLKRRCSRKHRIQKKEKEKIFPWSRLVILCSVVRLLGPKEKKRENWGTEKKRKKKYFVPHSHQDMLLVVCETYINQKKQHRERERIESV